VRLDQERLQREAEQERLREEERVKGEAKQERVRLDQERLQREAEQERVRLDQERLQREAEQERVRRAQEAARKEEAAACLLAVGAFLLEAGEAFLRAVGVSRRQLRAWRQEETRGWYGIPPPRPLPPLALQQPPPCHPWTS
jgi:hypothetical protein